MLIILFYMIFLFRIFYFNHLIVFNNSLRLLHACIFILFYTI